MTDNNKKHLKRLLTGSGLQVVTLGVGVIVGLLLTPYMISLVGDRLYGVWVLVASFTGWYGVLDLGLSSAINRHMTEAFSKGKKEACNAIANTGFFLYCGLAIIIFAIASGAAFSLPFFSGHVEDLGLIRILIVIMGLAFAIGLPIRAFTGVIRGGIRDDVTATCGLTFRILNASQTFLILYFGGRLCAIAIATCFLTAIQFAVYFHLTRRHFEFIHFTPRSISFKQGKRLFHFGIFSFIGQIANLLISRTDAFIIGGFVSLSAVTHYTLAITLIAYYSQILYAITGWLATWFTHLFAQNEFDRIQRQLLKVLRYTTYPSIFIAFGLVAWGKPFLERWMGPEYLDAYPCIVTLAIGGFFANTFLPGSRIFGAMNRPQILTFINVLQAILNLAMSLIAVHYWGILGVAIATMISSILVQGIVLPLVVCRSIGMTFIKWYFHFLPAFIVSALALMPAGLVTYFFATPDYISLCLVGATSLTTFSLIVFAIGLSKDERQKIVLLIYGLRRTRDHQDKTEEKR